MCAANQQVTLDTQAPSLAKSDVWDPSLASMSLEQSSDPAVEVDDGEQELEDLQEVTLDGGSSDIPDVNPPTSQPGPSVLDETECPGHIHPESLTGGTATSILSPNKRQSAVGGRKLKQQ
eukprot:3761214-Rhodomonas_salina.1